jgi:hypothetical protein
VRHDAAAGIELKHERRASFDIGTSMRRSPFIIQYLTAATFLLVAPHTNSNAVDVQSNVGHESPEAAFAAYKKAINDADRRALFALFTDERHEREVLHVALQAGTSKDQALRAIVKKYDVHWEEFDRNWTDDENKRLIKEMPTIAARVAKSATNKLELYVAAHNYIAKANNPSVIIVRDLTSIAREGATASAKCTGTTQVVETQSDPVTGATRQITREGSFSEVVSFRQVHGKWYVD